VRLLLLRAAERAAKAVDGDPPGSGAAPHEQLRRLRPRARQRSVVERVALAAKASLAHQQRRARTGPSYVGQHSGLHAVPGPKPCEVFCFCSGQSGRRTPSACALRRSAETNLNARWCCSMKPSTNMHSFSIESERLHAPVDAACGCVRGQNEWFLIWQKCLAALQGFLF
jgi:hypothetical protein